MMEESRKQFEEWFNSKKESMKSCGLGILHIRRAHDAAWSAWQASRAAIEIELPMRKAACASGYGEGYLVDSLMGDCLEYDETVESIRAAGLKIKGE